MATLHGIVTVRGSAHVRERNIHNLNELAQLPPDEATLLARADGIIATQPADGFVDVDELQSAALRSMLLANEAALLPAALARLQWDGTAAPDVGAAAPLAFTASTAADPPFIDRTRSVPIDQLPPELHVLARRVQLHLNGDGDATTISAADTVQMLAASELVRGLLPAERDLLPRLSHEVHALQNKLTPYPQSGTLDVSPPGVTRARLNDASSMIDVQLIHYTELVEKRTVRTVDLALRRVSWATFTVPPGMRALLIHPSTRTEHRLGEGEANLAAFKPGGYLLEIWDSAGRRVDASSFTLPEVRHEERIELAAHSNAVITSQGNPLVRNFIRIDTDRIKGESAVWIYEPVAGGAAPPADIGRFDRPKPPIAPGFYQNPDVRQGITAPGYDPRSFIDFEIEVKESGEIHLHTGWISGVLRPNRNGSYGLTQAVGNYLNAKSATFDGERLRIRNDTREATYVVQPQHRMR